MTLRNEIPLAFIPSKILHYQHLLSCWACLLISKHGRVSFWCPEINWLQEGKKI